MSKSKFYCYVDETGQDTGGRFFIVSVVLIAQTNKDGLEAIIEEIEDRTGKKKTKWTKAKADIRMRFLEEISKVKALQLSVYYSLYDDVTTYEQLTSLSVVRAMQTRGEDDYSVTVIVDALTKKGIEKMRRVLKLNQVQYDKIVGQKDEQSPFLRLADCFAGFIRDYVEGERYAKELFLLLEQRRIITEV